MEENVNMFITYLETDKIITGTNGDLFSLYCMAILKTENGQGFVEVIICTD